MTKIIIKNNFNGQLEPDTFTYMGSIKEWKELDKDEFFENIPCVNCIDGKVIQKL